LACPQCGAARAAATRGRKVTGDMGSAAKKRSGDAAGGLIDPPEWFCRALGSLPHNEVGRWRLCTSQGCRDARRCRGGADDCPESIDTIIVWLREACKAGCAGLSPRAAVRVADRHVLALRKDARRASKTK
jgi:hypothetical protein